MKNQTIIRILQGVLCTTALYTPQAMAGTGEILGETILPIVGIIFLIVATIHIIQKIITYHKQHIASCCNMWKKSTATGTDTATAGTDTATAGTDTATGADTTATPKRTGKKGRPKKSATKTAETKTQTKTISKGKRGRPRKSTAKKPIATTTTATEPPNNEGEQ